MIQLEHILTPGRSQMNVPGSSKKKILEHIASLLANDCSELDEDSLLSKLIARERLGSTGFGNGIAIPHCRLAGCTEPIGALLHLENPIDFDAIDGAPVDLLFVLLVPETATDEHLELLRQIASVFDRNDVREQLRSAADAQTMYQLFLTGHVEAEGN